MWNGFASIVGSACGHFCVTSTLSRQPKNSPKYVTLLSSHSSTAEATNPPSLEQNTGKIPLPVCRLSRVEKLLAVEQHAFTSTKIMYQTGKGNDLVPVLVPDNTLGALNKPCASEVTSLLSCS